MRLCVLLLELHLSQSQMDAAKALMARMEALFLGLLAAGPASSSSASSLFGGLFVVCLRVRMCVRVLMRKAAKRRRGRETKLIQARTHRCLSVVSCDCIAAAARGKGRHHHRSSHQHDEADSSDDELGKNSGVNKAESAYLTPIGTCKMEEEGEEEVTRRRRHRR